MAQATILIVDDEQNILTSLKRALEIEGYSALTADCAQACWSTVSDHAPDLILLDLVLPETDGIEILKQLKKKNPDLPVLMMSGNATIEHAVQATKLGAFDFIEKPISTEKLLIGIANALNLVRLNQENRELRQQAGYDFKMVGASAALQKIYGLIRKTAPSQGRVLITGENGTGKELVARALHQHSKRSKGPFIKVNCAAIPTELIESELFGHEKGSFTGATQRRKGKFELAHCGTIFLDEIGDMSLSAQAKVLRALQENEIERVGGQTSIKVDVRVVAATNKNLDQEIKEQRFREDLFYRLNVVPIELPALRQHKEDIPALIQHFISLACHQNGRRKLEVENEAVSLLMQYPWSGNVRELKNVVERLVILAEQDVISQNDVQECLPGVKKVCSSYRQDSSLKEMVTNAERDIILAALENNQGHVSQTAQELQLERSHLYKKMKALGINQ